MTRQEIIRAVQVKLEEFSNFENANFVLPADDIKKPIETYIDNTINEASDEVLLMLPLWLASIVRVQITPAFQIVDDNGGFIMIVKLPKNFLRMVSVKLKSWQRECNDGINIISHTHPDYKLQKNPFTRGKSVKPVAVVNKNHLELYSAADTMDYIESFWYIPRTLAEYMPNRLVEYVIMQAAIKILGIFGDVNGQKILQEQLVTRISLERK